MGHRMVSLDRSRSLTNNMHSTSLLDWDLTIDRYSKTRNCVDHETCPSSGNSYPTYLEVNHVHPCRRHRLVILRAAACGLRLCCCYAVDCRCQIVSYLSLRQPPPAPAIPIPASSFILLVLVLLAATTTAPLFPHLPWIGSRITSAPERWCLYSESEYHIISVGYRLSMVLIVATFGWGVV